MSLDFLRSGAIILVMFAHIILGYGAPPILAPLQLGGMGVDLFFVLSGWLLGSQLFEETSRFGSINIKRFWYRRWIRTFPAYYAVLGVISFQQVLTKDAWTFPVDYIFFIQNYNQPFEIFHVSWSLAVEEQFYLMIAPALSFLWCVPARTRLIILLSALIVPSFFRYFNFYENEYQTHVRIDGCIAGVLLAYVKSQHAFIWKKLADKSVPIFIGSSLVFFLYFLQRYIPIPWISDPGMLERAIMFSGWVLFAVTYKNSLFWRVYGVRYMATRSYSLYLLHPEAIAIVNRLNFEINFFFYFIAVFSLSLMFAEILYRVIEMPFLKLRSKLASTKIN
ncbi:putative acetyltransferase [Marinobacter sp. BSs20148]|nr:putative acetyltransferase [Marinobacter sp. BSs20148]